MAADTAKRHIFVKHEVKLDEMKQFFEGLEPKDDSKQSIWELLLLISTMMKSQITYLITLNLT
jgi:hypothetical protein